VLYSEDAKEEDYRTKGMVREQHIMKAKANFHKNVGKAYRALTKRRDKQEAAEILDEKAFKYHTEYEELQSPELRLEYLKLCNDRSKFKDSLDYLDRWSAFSKKYYGFQPPFSTYEDLIALYLNCK